YEEPNSSNRSRFDKVKIQGRLKESPRGTERKFRNTMSVCFLRTQQRAKSQCIRYVQTPVDRLFGAGHGYSHVSLMVGFLVSGLLFGAVWWQSFNGEFDPGSGRTLAACLTHASRTRCLHLVANG